MLLFTYSNYEDDLIKVVFYTVDAHIVYWNAAYFVILRSFLPHGLVGPVYIIRIYREHIILVKILF